MIARSMETLVLRMTRAAETGTRIARWLMDESGRNLPVLHPETVTDPAYRAVYARQCTGPGSTFGFVLPGGRPAAFRFINALRLFKSAVSLGGTESLVCHPASTTHSGVPADIRARVGVAEGLIRMSIGLEHPDDLIADLAIALAAAEGSDGPGLKGRG
jgi:methionine-gamma-lyase